MGGIETMTFDFEKVFEANHQTTGATGVDEITLETRTYQGCVLSRVFIPAIACDNWTSHQSPILRPLAASFFFF